MNLDEFVNKYLGKKVDWDGYYGGQCVDLYRQYVHDVLGLPQSPGVGGAAEIWNTAGDEYLYIDNDPYAIPQPGDIVIWNRREGGGFGHVAIYLDGDVNSFTSLDQNWPTLNKVTKTKHTYSNVIGWLHPKEIMANELETCMKDRKKFWEERDAARKELKEVQEELEGLKTTTAGYKSRITDLGNQLGTLQAEVDNRKEQVSRIEAQVLDRERQIKSLDVRLKTVNNRLVKVSKEKGALAIKLEQAKVEIETLKQQLTEGGVTLRFSDLWKLIWNQKITIRRNNESTN